MPSIYSVSALNILFGFAILLRWTFYYWLPPNAITHLLVIVPNEAICFIMAGLALHLLKTPFKQITGYVSLTIILIASLTLVEYYSNNDFGIDQLLIPEPAPQFDHVFPLGRMPVLAAVNFVLIGSALFIMNMRLTVHRLHQALVSVVVMTSLAALLLHLYRVQSNVASAGFDPYSQMSLLEIILFLSLGVSILFASNSGLLRVKS